MVLKHVMTRTTTTVMGAQQVAKLNPIIFVREALIRLVYVIFVGMEACNQQKLAMIIIMLTVMGVLRFVKLKLIGFVQQRKEQLVVVIRLFQEMVKLKETNNVMTGTQTMAMDVLLLV